MNIEKYESLTGESVDQDDVQKVTATIKRTKRTLENMLGYSLDKKKASKNQYEELGISDSDCLLTGIISDNLDNLTLDDPEDVIGSYRLYNYEKADQYLAVDPFLQVHAVKLVYIKIGDEPNGITHKKFGNADIRVHKKGEFSKYIEKCDDCLCVCECDGCVQLAVDADWINEECLPEELLYVWADMVEFYSDQRRDIIAETLGTHSYRRSAKVAPEYADENLKIIKKYAGPNGSVNDRNLLAV